MSDADSRQHGRDRRDFEGCVSAGKGKIRTQLYDRLAYLGSPESMSALNINRRGMSAEKTRAVHQVLRCSAVHDCTWYLAWE